VESLESLLRDEFRAPLPYAPTPVLDALDAAFRTRRRRVVAIRATGCAALAAIAAVVITIAAGPSSSGDQAAETAAQQAMEKRLEGFGLPVGGGFIDRTHGVVELERCGPVDPKTQQETCQDFIEVTSDGGVTFHEHALPSKLPSTSTHLYVFDAKHLVLAQSLGGSFSSAAPFPSKVPGMVERARWASSDGGVTWRSVTLDPGRPVTQIPKGAQILVDGQGARPTAVVTRDGVSHELTPAQAMMTPDGYVSADYAPMGDVNGSYFLYDGTVDTNVLGPGPPDNGLRVSLDMGVTWSPVHLPKGAAGPTVVGADDNWWYATAEPIKITDPQPVLASRDGGRTWQRLTVPPSNASDFVPSYAVLPSGGILYSNGADLWHAVGAGAFTRIRDNERTLYMVDLGPVVAALRMTPNGTITLATTTDGAQWENGTIK
jgi:hypothetical protein